MSPQGDSASGFFIPDPVATEIVETIEREGPHFLDPRGGFGLVTAEERERILLEMETP